MRAAGETDLYLSWAVWAAVMICGLTTALQAIRVGGFGAGYFHLMAGAPAFIAISITALVAGGPELLAALVIVSSLVPFIVSARLSLLRRVLTPTISGTVTMLIPVTVMPYVIGMLNDIPEGGSVFSGSVSFFITVCVIAMILLTASGRVRTWAPIVGIVIGSVVAAIFGIYDYERIAQATWIGFPEFAWRGINLDFGREFWAILPAFIFLALIESLKTIGTTVAVQNISWRRTRAVDFRSTQSSIAIQGVGKFTFGLSRYGANRSQSLECGISRSYRSRSTSHRDRYRGNNHLFRVPAETDSDHTLDSIAGYRRVPGNINDHGIYCRNKNRHAGWN